MNPTSTPSNQCARSERTPPSSSPNRSEPEKERCAADFERLLRDKGGWPGQDDGREAAQEEFAASMPEPLPPLPLQLPQASLPIAPAGMPAACAALASSPRTSSEPPLAAQLEANMTSPPGPDAGRSYEVLVNERMGVPLSLVVVQPGAAQAGAAWTLSIASSHLNPAVLKRYSGRLDERLRSRALSSEPVSILTSEHDDQA